MKKTSLILITLVMLLTLCACGQKAPTWEEQYDLGVRYLSNGNYEEAIIAFTTAIEIDPKRPEAFLGRGDAYVASTSELTATIAEFMRAESDYYTVIEIDATNAEVYKKLANLYLRVGDTDSAIAILEQGYQATGDEMLNAARQELGLPGTDEVVWTDPVFEQLIREKIGISTGAVYVKDLDEIKSLFIAGDTAVYINDAPDCTYRHLRGNGEGEGQLTVYYSIDPNGGDNGFTTRGEIRNADSLRYFRNLYNVSIIANHISDVSFLDEMGRLNSANFWANDITDFAPLDRMEIQDQYMNNLNKEQFVEIGDTLKE